MMNITVNKRTKELFDTDPKRFIKQAIGKFVRTSPANRLDSFGGDRIFEEPLVGFADGDDPLFNEYKKVVHESHFLPREILGLHLGEKPNPTVPNLESVSVISFVFPINSETLKANALEKKDLRCAGITRAGKVRILSMSFPIIWCRCWKRWACAH